ncbi:helix-turn-helix transcriptional regulator [Gloeocapsopsis dulcis]|uniref:AraC family transcriptional regulator n=1 Tax=Gloeocapsopsis dulcis AAB1 = 1H9 TaxID=1433147 RepID=A0A6N8FXV5_9CHRO|nr:AraC family transcriptional regulator [Gloeocapsopsis dulcis]MUL37155.1 AraC family transcriptional regulator [Gloeocapsopsis dulcis AAB1 = 1H9]WNN88439.1 AraC family transcriptional regulator [Gloeocapsopsis dulcis]
MTITLSKEAYWELFEDTASEETHIDDITQKYPSQLGQGYYRTVNLREGLELAIAKYQLHDDIILKMPERSHPIEYTFLLAGVEQYDDQFISAGHYNLCSSGIAPKEKSKYSATQPVFAINVHIEPELFTAFWHSESESTLPAVEQLLRGDKEYDFSSGRTTIAMQTAVQQILQCPYQSLTKRMYLESKVWELMALLIHDLERPRHLPNTPLKPDDIDRIHYAKEILLQQLDNPLSLIELARQVGLNDCTLKRGFRQVFGKTVFGYLHDYRLEQARQLLEQRRMNVSEIARSVGFANRSYFASAFRKKFGVNPRDYLNQKNSA